ncbi:MAG: CBS domain-containing protein, partial [Eudoraea sp.]|nr:CBS domain-containing protein [Eudoraea sp.]
TVHTIAPDTHVQKAATLMIDNRIHHLVVMEEERIVGIVSSMDFVNLVATERLK